MSFSNNNILDSFAFKHPFTCMIAGPTQSGKTTIIKKIISQCSSGLFDMSPDIIIYCYSQWQDAYEDIKNSGLDKAIERIPVEFIKGLPDIEIFNPSKKTLLILDDLMTVSGKDKAVLDIFTTDSHHQNISVIFVTQNIFSKEKNSRTISLNCQYIILTNNPRDRLQISILAKQIYPSNTKFLTESYYDAVGSKKYGYLILDFNQLTNDENRIQSGILEGEERLIYRNKQSN